MQLPDVNILVHAFRIDASEHERCRRWLVGATGGRSRFGISPQVLAGFLRVVTHPRVFSEPSGLAEALDFCTALTAAAQGVLVVPGERHWSVFEELCREADARGNLIPDAWFAALAIESGCEWVTLDRDYARFAGLRWSVPPVNSG